jgi:hypothetical protein
MGIGSAAVRKVLIRIEGPSSDPSDDVLLEAKALRRRGRVSCLERPASRPTFRIVVGSRQIGRLRHDILVAGPEIDLPEMNIQGQHLRDWWIRSWDASYREIGLSDLGSVQDLSDIAYDSGVQLAAGALHDANVPDDGPLRTQLLASLDGVERRIRNGAVTLVGELMHAWRDLGGR